MTHYATVTVLLGSVLALSASAIAEEPEPGHPTSPAFTTTSVCGLKAAMAARFGFLETCRPGAIRSADRQAVVDSLPAEGNVYRLKEKENAKLLAVARMLGVYSRDRVYAIRVIDIPQAWMGLHGRAVLLISKPVLRILTASQLQALAAHEAAHEYLWLEYQAARKAGNTGRLHEIEIACDGIAVRGLERLGLKPARLTEALELVQGYNQLRFGARIDATSHPPLQDRKRHIEVIANTKRTGSA